MGLLIKRPRAGPLVMAAVRAVLLVLLVLPGALGTGTPAAAQSGSQAPKKTSLGIQTATATHRFTVEVARTPRQHSQGLMYRRRLAADTGMLFIYSQTQLVVMWMKNTLIPLDMLFIAADGTIKHIAERAVPHSRESISSGQPVLAVLEINGGMASRLKIRVGDRVSHSAFGTGK